MRHKIFPAAKRAIRDIWQYTNRTWGTEQADQYVRGLADAVEKAGRDRSLWKRANREGVAGVFYVKHQRHFIFFRELGRGRLGVISVLHDNMNIPIRLKNDVDGV